MFMQLKASRGTEGQRRPGDHSSAEQTRASSRRDPVFCKSSQDVRVGGRITSSQYQYTLQARNPRATLKMGAADAAETADLPELRDVD